ncbi:hypothetical protein B0J18DRAFT_419783 [Chaetomium sp. MPI-SDFR-AT-0129]|nr:hypothetical protein B0J18DRAFT_419783 [Chaetomium sp. MPI-SDFR-AT-0129]
MVPPSPSSPHHRHQSSLEGIIDLKTEELLSSDTRDRAKQRFYQIVDHFEGSPGDGADDTAGSEYSRSRLLRLTHDHALSPLSQDNFLRAFFSSLELSMDGDGEPVTDEPVRVKFFGFADYLFNNFFLPLKASATKTPQPTPAFHSAIQRIQGGAGGFVGTPERISALRGACLFRDRYRCIVTRTFDRTEARKRMKRDRLDARDENGNLLSEEQAFQALEVAHILPHSLTSLGRGDELNPSKQAALAILNMFDHGVGPLIDGVDIDRPYNALTLTRDIHGLFGEFSIYFEPVPDAAPHTYRIQSFDPSAILGGLDLPITRTLFLTDDRTIDPPSARLLAIHSAIARILHLSAAGSYIDSILWDMEAAGEAGAEADGSTDLGRLVHLRLWLDGIGA